MAIPLAALFLASCASEHRSSAYAGAVAAPQVAYRIDEYRYFEVVPLQDLACARARLYYTDTARGIHENLANWDRLSSKGKFVIDAANQQYLVAPLLQSSPDCQTGDLSSDLCVDRLLYSQNAGRTWKSTRANSGTSILLVGSILYMQIGRHGGWRVSLAEGTSDNRKWDVYGASEREPSPAEVPVDEQFHCVQR